MSTRRNLKDLSRVSWTRLSALTNWFVQNTDPAMDLTTARKRLSI
jgi:hypothetical protein